MDDHQIALDGDDTQLTRVDTAEARAMDGRPPRRRVGIGFVALALAVALAAGVAGGVFVGRASDSSEETKTQTAAPVITRAGASAVGRMVPRWLPEGLTLRSALDGIDSGPPCQPDAFAGALPPASLLRAISVGPGVCAMPILSIHYSSDPMPGGSARPAIVTFVQAGAGDVRSSVATTSVTVRGKAGLLYDSGETLWLAWTEDAETTFFVTATGLRVDEMLRVAGSVEGIDDQAWAALRSTSSLAGAASNVAPGRSELVACLRAQGLDVPEVPIGPASAVSSRQYPPQATQAAWQACRDSYAKSSGMPTDQLAQILAFPDCMAAHGWLIVVMSGPATDVAAYSAALQKCQPAGSSTPPGQGELVGCLRAQGLDVPDAPTGANSVTLSRQYPPGAAQAAWQACRGAYIKTSGIPASPLSTYDCMAANGWIMAIAAGPPADTAAYGAAMQNCQPAPPGVVELVGCLRAQGLAVPESPPGTLSVVSAPRQYPPAAAQAAWQACRSAYITTSGIPASALSLYDCMAGQGWIVAISSGPPAAYGSARQNCAPHNP